METKSTNAPVDLAESFGKMAQSYVSTIRSAIENVSQNAGEFNTMMTSMGIPRMGLLSKKKNSGCCVPDDECPPHCLVNINHRAFAGERIIVPFAIKNVCQGQKKYRLGVRELKNIDGTLAPSQPILNKNEVTLEQGTSEMALMSIDLQQFAAGTYTAEIVIREKEINQNICFQLIVDSFNRVPVAVPIEENRYRRHWQSWQRHFYCENVRVTRSETGARDTLTRPG